VTDFWLYCKKKLKEKENNHKIDRLEQLKATYFQDVSIG